MLNVPKEIVVLIPARGGSQRCEGKNLQNFCGKPLLWYSIEFAKRLGMNGNIYVSSDSSRILKYAEEAGVHVLLRPPEFSGSNARISDVAIHLTQYLEQTAEPADSILLLQPSNPLRTESHFHALNELMKDSRADCVFTAVSSHEKVGDIVGEQFVPRNYTFENQLHHRNKHLCENGTMYLFKTKTLLETGSLFGKRALSYQIDDVFRYADINTPEELKITEFIHFTFKDKFGFVST